MSCIIFDILENLITYLWSHLTFFNIILSMILVFFQRRSPQKVWAWLLVLYFMPVVGIFLYLLVGQDYGKKKMFREKEVDEELKYAARRQGETIQRKEDFLICGETANYKKMILYNLEAGQTVLTDNNDIRIITDGQEKFELLIKEIRCAKRYIHIQYYIIRSDELWERISRLLVEKAGEGVEVRVLYDGVGGREFSKKDREYLKKSGVHIGEFFPSVLGKLQLRINYRNHRKIVVIDGRVGFLGGFNIGREYLGAEEKFGYWRDTHLRIEGAAVTSLSVRFIKDWNYAAKENLFLKDSLFKLPVYEREGKAAVQIVSGGPDSGILRIHDNYLQLIYSAKHHIYIQTPYLIPDEAILNALKIAGNAGIDVRIMIPCKPDHLFVYWATLSYVGELMEAGVKCYVYENGFLHAKVLCVDSLTMCVGTANMDIRSFELNFEVNAIVYDRKSVEKMEEIFKKDMEKSRYITKELYEKRGVKIRIKEQISRLLSPLL